MVGGDGCSALQMDLMPLNYALNSGLNGHLCYVYVTAIKRNTDSSGSGKAPELGFIHLFGNRFCRDGAVPVPSGGRSLPRGE